MQVHLLHGLEEKQLRYVDFPAQNNEDFEEAG